MTRSASFHRLLGPCLAAILLLSLGDGAWAQAPVPSPAAKAAAKALIAEGDRASAAGDNERALERYSKAYHLVHVPTVGMLVTKARIALGELVEARAEALAVAGLPQDDAEHQSFEQARAEAAALAQSLGGRIPTLALDIVPKGVAFVLELDGASVASASNEAPLPLNPGEHHLLVVATGYQKFEQAIALREAERKELKVSLVPDSSAGVGPAVSPPPVPPSAAASPAPTAGPVSSSSPVAEVASRQTPYVLLGIAGAAAAVGAVAGIGAFTTKPDCPSNRCPPRQRGDLDTSLTWGYVANASFGAAAVFGLLGAWYFAQSSVEDTPATATRSSLSVALGSTASTPVQLELSGAF